MSKFGLYSNKPSLPFETHLHGLGEQPRASLLEIRNFVKSLGDNVIEEVRPNRIVYAKSLTFRTFLDIQPKNDSLIISIRTSRNESATILTVNTMQEVEDLKSQIKNAYQTIQ
jgi:predicted transport protein